MQRNRFAVVRIEEDKELGGVLRSKNINRIKGFLLSTTVASVALLLAGCFQPESSLSNGSDDIRATFGGENRGTRAASLDPRTEISLQRYGSIVRTYSTKYDLDWRLVMAVMRHESRFMANAVSNRGAFGLMQIMPATQLELAGKLGVNETETPSNNIKAGAFHLQQLYRAIDANDEENHIRLTLAAYNAGINRILDAQDVAAYLGDDPQKWESVKSALPLLSRRYQGLHRNIWPSGKPSAGYFTDWHQTIGYVESVMTYYGHYQVALK
jgi:membrane-bound lytic murein transglycosylase MltF